ncbi:MAG TPA: serine/threonine-protein kinase [Kofleriaceae bacterium]|nr:serine/threonine-protein kinase [Kofleriaceae bacterium]
MPTDDDDLGSAATIVGASTDAGAGTGAGNDATQMTQSSLPSSRDSSPVIPPSVIADRYEILGLLGVGGMGRVYRAHDRALDEQVALKLLKRELVGVAGMLDRFRQEVKLARRVTSPHVVRTFDLGEHAGEHFLTMELVEGRSLAQLLDDGQLAVDEILRISRAMAAGIAAAHATGVTHRDLKPDNVLVGKDGRVAITDFGIARAAAVSPRETVDGFVGTPAYMAPEQVEGSDTIGPASDVYAFGAILFEMLAGRRPFVGSDLIAVAVARLREAPPDPRQFRRMPDSLADLALRCLERDAAQRFANGGELAKALAAVTTDGPSTLVNQRPQRVPAKTSRSVAIMPLRASGELAEVADGLSEEIVDALSMTRELRVRPLVSLRNAARAEQDSRELGKSLGVDVVVDGSIRKRGATAVRIAARVIGVEDGFQLWANHFDTSEDDLLAASDQVVRAIANALTVELEVPQRAKLDPKVADVYLETKAKLRTNWLAGGLEDLFEPLEAAHRVAPDDAGIISTLSLAHSRSAFYGGQGILARGRELADRATRLAPTSGEAWLALGVAALYGGDMAAATHALIEACEHAPGLALAQALLGAVCLEAGHLNGALLHLEGAQSLDPFGPQLADLPRAYVYAGREDEAMRMLEAQSTEYRLVSIARFKMWKGERYTINYTPSLPPTLPPNFSKYARVAANVHRTAMISAEDRAVMDEIIAVENPRLSATRAQFVAEFYIFCGELDAAMGAIEMAVKNGLQDHLWMQKCPLLDSLRDRPRFIDLATIVAARARVVLDVIDRLTTGEFRTAS